mgnify:CR=1 FL=1
MSWISKWKEKCFGGGGQKRIENVRKILEEGEPEHVWLAVKHLSVIAKKTNKDHAEPGTPEEMFDNLKEIERHLGKYPELLADLKKNAVHGLALKGSIAFELFNYWLENGTTTNEVEDVFLRLFGFEWLYWENGDDVTQSVSIGLLSSINCKLDEAMCDTVSVLLEGAKRACVKKDTGYAYQLKTCLQLIRTYLQPREWSNSDWQDIVNSVAGMSPSLVAHAIFCSLYGLDTAVADARKQGILSLAHEILCSRSALGISIRATRRESIVRISEGLIRFCPSGTVGSSYIDWEEIVSAAAPPLYLTDETCDLDLYHGYIMTAAVIFKLPEIWPEVERLGAYENVIGLLQKLNRPDARREDYKYLDNEWDRLREMLKAITWTQV